jgi:hypothetical protein
MECSHLLVKKGNILVPAGAVGDDVKGIVVEAGDHGIVDDAARLGPEQGRKRAAHGWKSCHARRTHGFKETGRVRAREPVLHHVADVKEGRLSARKVVRVDETERRIQDRHEVAGKGDHLGTMRDVEVV